MTVDSNMLLFHFNDCREGDVVRGSCTFGEHAGKEG